MDIDRMRQLAIELVVMAYELNTSKYANIRTMWMYWYSMGAATWIVGELTVEDEIKKYKAEHPEINFDGKPDLGTEVQHGKAVDTGIHLNRI